MFQIPTFNETINSNKFKMDISLNFLSKPNNSIIETFKMDEYAADSTDDDGYQPTRVYIHQINDYPFDFNFEVPVNCRAVNNYIVEKTQEEIYYALGASTSCRIADAQESSYGVSFKMTRKTLCESLVAQQDVWNKCQCIFDHLPNNQTSNHSMSLCSDNENLLDCSDNILANGRYIFNTSCLPTCTKTDYNVLHRIKPFYTSIFSERMDSILYQKPNCDANSDSCTNMVGCMIQLIHSNNPNNINCNSKVNVTMNKFENYINSNFSDFVIDQDPSNGTSTFIKYLFDSKTECTQINIKVDIRRKMRIQTESLVVEVNTLLSQMGGICAFFTGLTFTFLAEVIEIFIFWINDIHNTTPSS